MIKIGNFKTRADLGISDTTANVAVKLNAALTSSKNLAVNFDWVAIQESLKQHLLILKTIAGFEDKKLYKAGLIDNYRPIVTELLATKSDLSGLDLVWWWYQWRVDVEGIESVYADFKSAIERNLQTPDTWKSNAQTALVDIVYKHSLAEFEANKPNDFALINDVRSEVEQGKIAINVALKSKIYRLLGDISYEKGDKQQALDHYEYTLELDPRCGRKTKLQELKEVLANV